MLWMLLAAPCIHVCIGMHSLTTGSRYGMSLDTAAWPTLNTIPQTIQTYVAEQEQKQPVPQTQDKPVSGPYAALSGSFGESGGLCLAALFLDNRTRQIKLVARHAGVAWNVFGFRMAFLQANMVPYDGWDLISVPVWT